MSNLYNTPEENLKIAQEHDHFVVSLTNGMTHYDVCFSVIEQVNKNDHMYHSGIATQKKSLLVAINYRSAFVFSLSGQAEVYSDYVCEKLFISYGDMEIAEEIAQIINTLRQKHIS